MNRLVKLHKVLTVYQSICQIIKNKKIQSNKQVIQIKIFIAKKNSKLIQIKNKQNLVINNSEAQKSRKSNKNSNIFLLNENESELTATTMNKLMIVKLLFVLHLCQCVRGEVIHAGTRKLRYYFIPILTGFE